ncbi:hypothetical protein BO70DRAFT_405128 [Aspergillus heteromorphus CBS 117.55]|uniref:Uncharacterized protein n=1 Tax=Aspergillus heteromorphus CBS 117.55 TaxID=1448321 RepID=A0A317WD06_9EURO|nr:uncharacterized protein BO70DRAFT_405128 [Aspergillus heteromorphus CBS 117.55]PWY82050.1 hypothetical protein BO70DRAFT_405128 [Aspergillus heteromorphus CBS 117.55]
MQPFTSHPASSSERLPTKNNPPLRTTQASRKKVSPWWWEIAASALSIACLVILVVLLKHVDGMPYADWAYRVSPNAVLSVVATANRAALLFPVCTCLSQLKWNQYRHEHRLYDLYALDQASRGIWGSFQMVVTSRPNLATLGAATMVLSAALDPLTQQILVFPSRIITATNETASAQTAQVYSPTDPNEDDTMNLAVLRSVYGSDTSEEPVCSTGSCQYPDFDALGACSQCRDVTSETEQNCTALASDTDVLVAFQNSTLADSVINCTYTTPGGLQLTPGVESAAGTPVGNSSGVLFVKDSWTFASTSLSEQILTQSAEPLLAGILNPVVGLAVANYSYPYTAYVYSNISVPETKPQMTECALYLCAQRYVNNTYTSDEKTLSPSQTEQLFVNETFSFFFENYLAPMSNETDKFAINGTYMIQGNTVLSIVSSFQTTVSLSSDIESGWSYAIQYGAGAGSVMDRVAASITDSIRDGPNTTTIPGEAFTTQTYISVRWYWIIVPIAVTVMSLLFLILIILHTGHARGVGVWKSSALALLACKLEHGPDHPDLQTMEESEMEIKAKDMYVSWDMDSAALALTVGRMKA